MTKIYTIGHSTRSISEFMEILTKYKIRVLVDLRSLPGSRYNPQYNQAALKQSLKEAHIEYIYIDSLTGFRKQNHDSINLGWHNKSFRAFADWMQTSEYKEGVNELIHIAKNKTTVIMCSESVPWRCHRSLISDSLITNKITVIDIYNLNKIAKHKLTSFAKVVNNNNIYYPG